jgi:hypothetical protein
MLKNICKYLAVTLAIVCVGPLVFAQAKPSDQKLSVDIIKIKQMQAQRNSKAAQVKQSTPSDNSTTPPGNGPAQPTPPRSNGKPSEQPVRLPAKPVVHH